MRCIPSNSGFHPVLAAAKIAFGFVFFHPFVDGNGKLHRYLIHHLLAAMRFSPQGIIFPVSAGILEYIDDLEKRRRHILTRYWTSFRGRGRIRIV